MPPKKVQAPVIKKGAIAKKKLPPPKKRRNDDDDDEYKRQLKELNLDEDDLKDIDLDDLDAELANIGVSDDEDLGIDDGVIEEEDQAEKGRFEKRDLV